MAAGAPPWVTYVALGTSLASLWISFTNLRASGHQVRVFSETVLPRDAEIPGWPHGLDKNPNLAFMRVVNRGRGAVDVESFIAAPEPEIRERITRRPRWIPAWINLVSEGPALPYRLDGSKSQIWTIDATRAREEFSFVYSNLRVGVLLGTGEKVYPRLLASF